MPLFKSDISTLLTAHPNETLYSIVSRLHAYWGYTLASKTNLILFGRVRGGYHHDPPPWSILDARQHLASPSVPVDVDCLFFGRSIHWFPADSLKRLSSDLLKSDGKIAVCSTQWLPVGDWGKIYFETRQKYVSPLPPMEIDFSGEKYLAQAGFYPIKRFVLEANIQVSSNYMVGHTFSTAYHHQISELESKATEFKLELTEKLRAFETQKQIIWKVRSWAIAYGRKR